MVFAIMLLIEVINLANPYIYGKIVDGIVSGKPIVSVIILLFNLFGNFANK